MSAAQSKAPPRRGACPTLAAPMSSGDGLLARVAPPEGLAPAALAGFAAAAARWGNGILEVTSRGSLQARGLRPETAGDFAAAAAALGIAAEGGAPVLTGPLAGLDPAEIADPRPLAAALRRFAEPLPPKVSVIVDGGGALHLDALPADLRLRATPRGWIAAAGGDAATARPLGLFDAEGAIAAGLAFLALLSARGARGRDIDLPDLPGLVAAEGARPAATPVARPAATPVGRFALTRGIARGVAPAFGQTDAAALAALAASAEGAAAFRPAPGRGLVAVGLDESGDRRLAAAAAGLGFVVDPADPRLRIVACAGAPACGAALLPTRAIAARLAGRAAAPEGAWLHLSGCPKRCAQPPGAAASLVGGAAGPQVTGEGIAPDAALRALLLREAFV